MDRKKFLINSTLAGGSLFMLSSFKGEPQTSVFTIEEIYEFVAAAHSNLEKTKKIVDAKPLILNATSQVVQGDFETALGGASHMGRRDIADLLILRGARMDIFSLTFLGYTDFVRKQITTYPHLLNSYGPHGFTLLHHAKVGKHKELANWFINQGLIIERNKDVFNE